MEKFVYEISENIDTYTERSYISIDNIYVKEAYHRRGIGIILYNEDFKYAKSIGIKKLNLLFIWIWRGIVKF